MDRHILSKSRWLPSRGDLPRSQNRSREWRGQGDRGDWLRGGIRTADNDGRRNHWLAMSGGR